jgi:hypothetical protein
MEPWEEGVSGILLSIKDDEGEKAFAECREYIE